MTKAPPYNPQPTPDVGSHIYLMPRSKEPRIDALYVFLHDSGWRFDTVGSQWFTPIDEPEQRARLAYSEDHTRAWLQPPGRKPVDDELPKIPDPIAKLKWFETEHFVGWDWEEWRS